MFTRGHGDKPGPVASTPRTGGGFPLLAADTALNVATVYRCVNLLADSVASLPVQYMRMKDGIFVEDRGDRLHYLLNVQPCPWLSAVDFWQMVVRHILLRGNAYIVPEYDPVSMSCARLALVSPSCVAHDTVNDTYTINDVQAGISGVYGEDEVIHIKNYSYDGKVGLSTLSFARVALSITSTGDQETLSRFANGGNVRGIVSNDTTSGGIVPVKVQDILDPLVEGLILNKVGLPMPTGLAGDYIWPTYETVEATIQGEGVALTDTKIKMSKLTASPQRIGIAIPVTRQAINQTEGVVEMIVKKLMPLSVTMLLNKIMFSTTKVTGATTLLGPFVALAGSAIDVSAEPTFREFNAIKAKVLATGVDGEHLCWVMTKAQKAIAEATPKDKGSGIMVCENDHIAGLPVFTTGYIGEGYIGLGDWRYQPMGLFGDISFVIDPYSQARKDAVDFVLNVNYGTTTLRKEAFALAKVKAAPSV